MDANDAKTIDVAATFLRADLGLPVSECDYEVAFLAGLILAGGSGQHYTDAEISVAVTEAVRRAKR